MALIIFEGNENSGKSTMAEMLREHLSHIGKTTLMCKRWTHKSYWAETHTKPDGDPYPENWNLEQAFYYDWRFFMEMLTYDKSNLDNVHVLCDRSFITDFVFKQALYKEHINDRYLQTYNAYMQTLMRMPHLVVYCKRILEKSLEDNFSGGYILHDAEYLKLQKAYDEWACQASHMLSLNFVEVDNSANSKEDSLQTIIGAMQY